jgi:hypothetical protein
MAKPKQAVICPDEGPSFASCGRQAFESKADGRRLAARRIALLTQLARRGGINSGWPLAS